MSHDESNKRPIRTYVKRMGRATVAQRKALEELLPEYGVSFEAAPLDTKKLFEREGPLVVHIGFGMGEGLLALAKLHPETNYLGIEVHEPGVGALLNQIPKHDVKNIRVLNHDALEVLNDMIEDDSLAGVELFFPDPWPKKRHHKRRMVNDAFNALVFQKLEAGGYFHLATDWEPYAEWMMEHLLNSKLKNQHGATNFAPKGDRPLTKFEQRGERLGHGVWDLVFVKT